jgi:SAM-dependent methyltransferase
MALIRSVESEWLDELADGDPRAVRARSELRTVNALMGNARILARLLERHAHGTQGLRIAELGSGDGAVMAKVARRLRRPGTEVTLVDRSAQLSSDAGTALQDCGWKVDPVSADAFAWLAGGKSTFDVIVANLFLHHFRPPVLQVLLALVAARTRLFIACEPERSSFALLASRLLWAIGCGQVTRHDAQASVRAGFRADELASGWTQREGWTLEEGRRGLFSHGFVAARHA